MTISLNQIEQALQNREFYLAYMPTITLADNKCVGAETLIRWDHAGLDIPPDEFIPQCEGTPIIGLLTFWLIEQLGAELGDWLRATNTMHVSINASPDMIGRGGMMYAAQKANLSDMLDKIVLEVTERGLADQQAIDSIRNAHKYGIRVALDDFGTGDANLLEISKLSAHIIKLDKYFIDQLVEDAPVPAIIRGLIGFAHGMDMELIAEGVETDYQLQTLRELGVEMAQGWQISKPLRAVDLIEFCADRN